MNGNFNIRSYLRTAIIKALQRLVGPENASWIRAIEGEASNLPGAQGRWIAGGLLGLAIHRVSHSLPRFIPLVLLPLTALMLFTMLARLQFLIWDSGNSFAGMAILLCSIAPFAWQLGRLVNSRPLIWSLLAFTLFQSAPSLLWPLMFGEPIGLEWGVNIAALGIHQGLAPFLTFVFWACGTMGAARIMAPRPKR